uniref:PiggyBac transposable element-derived protein domain-containing protein n=1 Tax=Acanthochromis polyacanthus TaxID=80966 RepID=A0A3Q1ECD4_9TELE
MNVGRVMQLFFRPGKAGEEEDSEPESDLESEDFDDDSESQSDPWKTEKDPDSVPDISRFQPRRQPGIQLETLSTHSPKELFQLFFATDTVLKMCKYTNKHAARNKELGKKYKWVDVEMDDLYKFFGLLFYMSLVSLCRIQDYWRQNHIFYVPFPAKVMPRDRFQTILWNIYLSDLEEDEQNDKKGTPGHDKLARVRPLYEAIRCACQAYYHPKRELAVDERMVAAKAKTGMKQYMKVKPNKWGIKLFVLAESSSGYTIQFDIHTGKTGAIRHHGLAYDVVMNLIQKSSLGTGYHIYMDNFYTSPRLFKDLTSMKFGACGTYREGRKGFPRVRENDFTRDSERGSVRWIRQGQLLFVKWLDTQEVSMCSTIHPAFSGDMVERRMKDKDGSWTTRRIPCPTPVLAYNKNMGRVEQSDKLIQYYSTLRKTACWYKTLLLHFLDIAATNAYVLHCELSSVKSRQPMTHKEFMTVLVCQLCDVDMEGNPRSRKSDHIPVAISEVQESAQRAPRGRLRCKRLKNQTFPTQILWCFFVFFCNVRSSVFIHHIKMNK